MIKHKKHIHYSDQYMKKHDVTKETHQLKHLHKNQAKIITDADSQQ